MKDIKILLVPEEVEISLQPVYSVSPLRRSFAILKVLGIEKVYTHDKKLKKLLGKRYSGIDIHYTNKRGRFIKLKTNVILKDVPKIRKNTVELKGIVVRKDNIKEVKKKIFELEAVSHKFHNVINPYTKYVNLPISEFMTKIFLETRLSPNQITLFGFVLGIIGIVLMTKVLWLGALIYFISYFLDAVDGKVARIKFMKSNQGFLLDKIVDIVLTNLGFVAVSIYINQAFYFLLACFAILFYSLTQVIVYIHFQIATSLPIKISTQPIARDFIYFLVLIFSLLNIPELFLLYIVFANIVYFFIYLITSIRNVDKYSRL